MTVMPVRHKFMVPDGIQPIVMRELAEELSKPLSIIYQQSWLTGRIPADWRWGLLAPAVPAVRGQKEKT